MYPVVFHVPSGSAPLLVNVRGQHGQHGQVSGAISLVAVTELEAGSWELADVTMVTMDIYKMNEVRGRAAKMDAIHCYTLSRSLKFIVLAKYQNDGF